jgi:hypothetical protein
MSCRTYSSHNVAPLQQFLVCMQFGCKSISHRECKRMQKQYRINSLWQRRRNEEKEMRKRRNSHKKKKEKTKLLRRQQLLPAGVMSSCFAMTRRGGREGERNFHGFIMDGRETKNIILAAKTLPSRGFIWPWEIDNG